jgi:hypothetical protein
MDERGMLAFTQTVSLLALYYLRAASAQTRSSAIRLADDLAMLSWLRHRYLGGRPRVNCSLLSYPRSLNQHKRSK